MSVKIKEIVGQGPQHPKSEHVSEIVEQIRQSVELRENFFQNFEELASELEAQSRQGKGAATAGLREECSWQAANIRRFVSAVKKRLATP